MPEGTKKERVNYIDVAKGLLIVLVFVGHMARRLNVNGDDAFLSCFTITREYLWTSFYMPAFFVITGYCSNFALPFKTFVEKNIKTLIIPAVCLVIPSNVAELIFKKITTEEFLLHTLLTSFWFLRSLFLAKIMFYFCYRFLRKEYLRSLFCLTLFIGGVCLVNYVCPKDLFNIAHALLLLPFLEIGWLLKKYSGNNIYKVSTIAYAALVLVVIGMRWDIPSVTFAIKVSPQFALLFLLLASTGSVAILWVSKLIKKSFILELLGRHSLVLYCIHVQFYTYYSRIFHKFICINYVCSALTLIISTLLLVAICLGVSIVLNKKPFCYCLGKF